MKRKIDYTRLSVLAFAGLVIFQIGIIMLSALWSSFAKTFIIFVFLSAVFFILCRVIKDEQLSKLFTGMALFIFITTVLSWNYLECIMEPSNTMFPNYQADSESLVTTAIKMAHDNVNTSGDYGLFSDYMFPYISQYGFQGKLFSCLTNLFNYEQTLYVSHMLCGYLASVIFTGIVVLIKKKYNILMAGCFLVTFWLSPWVVSFARNLYWVEFTWFLPMLIGLFCSIFIKKKWCRIISYLGVFFSILIKSLCGYEYISCIMLGMISFLVVDLICALFRRDKENAKLLFKTTFFVGLFAVLGFVVALLMHAGIRGEGDLFHGLELIYRYDVLKRISVSTDAALFENPLLQESIVAPLGSVLRSYFGFTTEIILGIPGKLFTILTILPVFIFVMQYVKKKLNINDMLLYVVFFITSISWFVLAKPHSHIHKHMNYVLWYFGFVQICFYIILNHIRNGLIQKEKVDLKEQ